jgi:NF-X1-type zinc finger protein NFXL1
LFFFSFKICNKPYSCGYHFCEKICHVEGDCGDCVLATTRRNCPCGKTKSLKPCTDQVLPCGDTCDKDLDCGRHKCTRRCHFGSCDSCRQMIQKNCRCGKGKEKLLPCYQIYTCDIKCNIMRNCGKHKCNKKCCDGLNCPPCEQLCNKLLSCKNHKCASLCHSGNCYPVS